MVTIIFRNWTNSSFKYALDECLSGVNTLESPLRESLDSKLKLAESELNGVGGEGQGQVGSFHSGGETSISLFSGY